MPRVKKEWLWIGLVALGVVVRLLYPEADPDAGLCFCQSENVDWPWYLNRAFSSIGLTNADPSIWADYRSIFFTAFSKGLFKIFLPTPVSLTFLSLFPALLILLFAFLLARRFAPREVAWQATAIAALNPTLVGYARVPGVYPWVVVFALAAVWLSTWEVAGIWIAGVWILTAAVMVKTTLLFFLPCLCLAAFLSHSLTKRSLRTVLSILLIGILSSLFSPLRTEWLAASDKVRGYLLSLGNFSDLIDAFQAFISVQLHFQFQYARSLLAVAMVVMGLMLWRVIIRKENLPWLDAFFIAIFTLGLGSSFLLWYRPVRYFLFLTPISALLALRLADYLPPRFATHARKVNAIIICLILFESLWGLSTQLRERTYSWKENWEDTAEILPAEAVAVGAYSQLLTLFSSAKSYRSSAYPKVASHLIVDENYNLHGAKKDSPESASWVLLDHLFVRGYEVHLYRLSGVQPLPSLYERGRQAAREKNFDEAERYLRASQAAFPHSGASTRALLVLALNRQDPVQVKPLTDEAIRRNSSHPFPWLVRSRLEKQSGDLRHSEEDYGRYLRLTRFSYRYRKLMERSF